MIETQNLVRKYTHIFSFRKYTTWYQDPLSFTDVSIFLQKLCIFWQKQYLYSKQQCESCVRDFLVLFSVFVNRKVAINENVSFTDHASETRLPDGSKLAINWNNDNDVTIYRHEVIVIFFDAGLFLLSSLVTDLSFMSTSSLALELWQFSFVRD